MSKKNRSVSVGPFAEAAQNVYDISSNMFLAYMLQESIDKYEQTKKEYDTALSNSDDAADLQQKKLMLEVCAASMKITVQMFDHGDGVASD